MLKLLEASSEADAAAAAAVGAAGRSATTQASDDDEGAPRRCADDAARAAGGGGGSSSLVFDAVVYDSSPSEHIAPWMAPLVIAVGGLPWAETARTLARHVPHALAAQVRHNMQRLGPELGAADDVLGLARAADVLERQE